MNQLARRAITAAGILAGLWIAFRTLRGRATANPKTFFSGLSRSPRDMRKIIRKRAPVGIAVLRPVSRRVRKQVIDYVNAKGGHAFLDSGAFTAFTQKRAMTADDWKNVLFSYREMINNIHPEKRKNIWIVAPDVVGSARKTIGIQSRMSAEIKPFIQGGVNVIFPAQKGKRISVSMADVSDSYAPEEWERITVGIPFNESAWSEKDVLGYLKHYDRFNKAAPIRVHLLGAGAKKVSGIVKKATAMGISAENITSDAMFPEIGHRRKGR